VSRPHPIVEGLNKTRTDLPFPQKKGILPSDAFELKLPSILSLQPSYLPHQILDLLSLHGHVNQFLEINIERE
jgi:hypothetical protein